MSTYVRLALKLVSQTDSVLAAAGKGDWAEVTAGLAERARTMAEIGELDPSKLGLLERQQAAGYLARVAEQDTELASICNGELVKAKADLLQFQEARGTTQAYRRTMGSGPLSARFVDKLN